MNISFDLIITFDSFIRKTYTHTMYAGRPDMFVTCISLSIFWRSETFHFRQECWIFILQPNLLEKNSKQIHISLWEPPNRPLVETPFEILDLCEFKIYLRVCPWEPKVSHTPFFFSCLCSFRSVSACFVSE